MTKTKVAIICPYPHNTVPGQRFRYEQYLDFLAQQGLQCDIYPFLDQKTYHILYQQGYLNSFKKAIGVLFALLNRFLLLFKVKKYNYIFVYREATLVGPPFFEWITAKLLKKKMIVDFDDAIWLTKTVSNNPFIGFLRQHRKTEKLCHWAYKVSCGNEFLGNFARQFNKKVIHLPTTIDTENYHNQTKKHTSKNPVVIGWTGTITTMVYLLDIYPLIEQLAEQYDLIFCIISNKQPSCNAPFIRYVPWCEATEIEDLMQFDIGIMPMKDTEWEQGKCGFKALQYMALGIPALVSPVGVNAKIVVDGYNGFYANNEKQWLSRLQQLIESPELRQKMGQAGQQTVQKYYSVTAMKEKYLSLFNS